MITNVDYICEEDVKTIQKATEFAVCKSENDIKAINVCKKVRISCEIMEFISIINYNWCADHTVYSTPHMQRIIMHLFHRSEDENERL